MSNLFSSNYADHFGHHNQTPISLVVSFIAVLVFVIVSIIGICIINAIDKSDREKTKQKIRNFYKSRWCVVT